MISTLFGLLWAVVLIGGLAGLGIWLYRGYQRGDGVGASLFGQAREHRLGVTETATIDGRRKLLLIRRDGVEHLVMTGGPIDIVIEQGISPAARPAEVRQLAPLPAERPTLVSTSGGEAVSVFGRVRQRIAPRVVGEPPGDGSQ